MANIPTIFLSAANIDLREWREVLQGAFTRAGFQVFTQEQMLGGAPHSLKRLLTEMIAKSDCIVHLAGMGYGADATDPFPDTPSFQCSWAQFEYYYAHQQGKRVIAFVCAPDLSMPGFFEKGEGDERDRKAQLQRAHRERVATGTFDGTPLAGAVRRITNQRVDSVQHLFDAVAAAIRSLKGIGDTVPLEGNLHQLPPRPQGFVGREADLAKLRKLAHSGGVVLAGLRGMGGIGKTALALTLAHEWAPQFPDAQLFLDANGTHPYPPSARKLMEQVVLAFHPTVNLPDDDLAITALYREVLMGKKALILLDNARDAAQVNPLIPPVGCALIVTSRQNFMLDGIPLFSAERLSDFEAAALLREYNPALTDAETTELVRFCAGLPLALRLAGAHLALDSAERGDAPDVAGYLRKLRRSRLATLDADAGDAGEVTISETLRLSEEQLPEREREAWRKVGVFRASFDARAAEAIAGAEESMLNQFARHNLLVIASNDRYEINNLAAEYACAQLTAEVLAALHLAHARHYTSVAEEADGLYLKGHVDAALALFDRERAQVEAAYAWLAGRTDETAARQLLALVDAVAYTSDLRFDLRQRIAWLESQLRAARIIGDRHGEGNALGNLGIAHRQLGDARKAIEFYGQRLIIAREIGDRRGEGNALGNLGNAHADLDDARQAITFYEQQLAITREIGDRRGEGNALGSLGIAHRQLGDTRKAIDFYGQRLIIAREIGDRRGEGNVLGNLGNAHSALGDARQALEYYKQQLLITREIGDRRGEGSALGNLGNVHAALGEARRAIEFYEQGLRLHREIGDRRGEARDLWNSALAYDLLGERALGIPMAKAALAICEAIADPNAAIMSATLAKWRN